jgi:ketosteroid isomerase-like protein
MRRALLLAVVFFSACASANAPGDTDAALTAHRRAFADNARSGNAAGLAAGYAEDAILMPPNAPAMRGRAAIQQFWGGFLGLGKIDVVLTPEKFVASGDVATEAGKYDLTITPNGGAPIHDVGKYSETFRKTGSQWLTEIDIFNSDLPAPPPPR